MLIPSLLKSGLEMNKSIHASTPKYVFPPFHFYSSKILMMRISFYSFLALFPPCPSYKGNLCPHVLPSTSDKKPWVKVCFWWQEWKHCTQGVASVRKRWVHSQDGLQTSHSSTLGGRKGRDFQVTDLDWSWTETPGNFSNLWLRGAESNYLPVICTD